MAQSSEQNTVTTQELLIATLAQSDALAKLLIEEGIITMSGLVRHFGSMCSAQFTLPDF